jgi:hypothetical protein
MPRRSQHCRITEPRPPRRYRPALLALEDRLSLGETLLSR